MTKEVADQVVEQAIRIVDARFFDQLLPRPHASEIIAWDLLKQVFRSVALKEHVVDAVVAINALMIAKAKEKNQR